MIISSLGGGVLPLLLSHKAFAATLDVCNTSANCGDFSTIQAAINAANTGDTISVAAGTYIENVNVNKSVTLTGSGAASTTIVATDADATPLQFSANDATVSGFTITHNYTPAELSAWNFNNNGVLFNQTRTGDTLKDSTVTLSRNGVYINTARNNSLVGDTITNNRTGINLTGDFTGTTLTGNTISNNWTEGLVAYGTNTPGIDLSSVTLSGNTFDSNWYEQALVKSPTHATTSTLTGTLDLNGNSFTDSPITYTTSNDTAWDEPGFADEIPTSLGGTATKPAIALPTLRIYGTPGATLEYSPKTLLVGTDEPYTTIQAAIADASAGDTIRVDSGTYNMTTAITVNKQLNIEGQAGATINTSGSNQIFTFTASGSTLNGFTITKTDNTDQNIIGIQANNTTISNDDFSGQYSLAANAGTTRAIVVSTSTGSTISGNTITNLRQPAYINDNATGQINNNHVDDTRGWVMIADSNFSFNGNTWGTNATDIAVIDNDANPATPVTDNYTCSVMQTIRANNNNAVIDNQVLTTPCPLDTPTNLAPPTGTYTNDPAFVDSWSAVTGAAGYEYRTSNSLSGSDLGPIIYSDTTTTQPSRYDLSGSTVTRANGGTPEGTYYWQVRATGPGGATSDWSVINKVVVDTTAPTVPLLQSPSNTGFETTNDFYFKWTVSTDANPVTYEFQSANNNSFSGAWDSIANGNSEQNNLTSPQIHSTGAPDGTYYWRVRAIDAAGNKSDWTDPWVMTIDTQTPTVPTPTLTANNTGAAVANGGSTNSQFFTFHFGDNTGIDHYELKYWNNISGSSFDGAANAWSPSPDLSAYMPTSDTYQDTFTQGEGTHFFAFSACDAAGNCSAYSDPFVVTYDKTAPNTPNNLRMSITATDTNIPDGGSTNQQNVTAAWDSNNTEPVTYIYHAWFDNSSQYTAANPWVNPLSATSYAGSFNQGDGTFHYCVIAVDAAGNQSNCSAPFTATYDSVAPVVTVNTLSTTNSTPMLTGTVDDNTASVSVVVNGHTYGAVVTGNTWTADVTNALPVGTYDVAATATDLAGNTGTDSTTNELTIAASAPAITTNTNTITITNTNFQIARTGNANNNGNTNGGNAGTGAATNTNSAVLGASTDNSGDQGQVKGDSTVKVQNAAVKKDGKFIGLGWWWILIVAAAVGFFWFILGRRSNSDEKA